LKNARDLFVPVSVRLLGCISDSWQVQILIKRILCGNFFEIEKLERPELMQSDPLIKLSRKNHIEWTDL
jgi:hypothetical protein